MIYVGIDVAKDKHDVHIRNGNGCVLENHFTIANNRSGFNHLLSVIDKYEPKPQNVKVGLEATGRYCDNLCDCLAGNSKIVYRINPALANNFCKGRTLRSTKTDAMDARGITDMLMSGMDLEPYRVKVYHKNQLKSLARLLDDCKTELAKQKVSLSNWVVVNFPELESAGLFSSIHCNTVYELLKKYPGPQHVASARIKTLANLTRKASNGACRSEELAVKLRDAAAASIGYASPADSLELKLLFDRIDVLEKQIKVVEKEILAAGRKANITIGTIPGVGEVQAMCIAAEIGDINRFSSPDKLLAYAGMSPTKHDSGKKQNSKGHIEKRGSRYLRKYLYRAASLIWLHNPIFAEYYKKKIGEGKHHCVAVIHMVKKLVRIIYAMMKSGEVYRT